MSTNARLPISPNQLTVLRILVTPVLLVLIYLDRPHLNWVALGLFILAALTDYLDGELARRRGEVSRLGKLLDPVADKILTLTCLIMLVALGHADVWATIIIISREFAIAGLRQVVAAEGVVIAAERGAKWKTAVTMTAIGFLLIHRPVWGLPVIEAGWVLLWLAAILSITSGLSYVRHYFATAPKP